jgi:hypothetical protein
MGFENDHIREMERLRNQFHPQLRLNSILPFSPTGKAENYDSLQTEPLPSAACSVGNAAEETRPASETGAGFSISPELEKTFPAPRSGSEAFPGLYG